MGKYKLIAILMVVTVILGACSNQQAATPTVTTAAVSPTAQAQTQPTTSFNLPSEVNLPGCTVVSQFPTPGPTQESLYPSHKDTDWSKGPEDAKVTIIEYSDFQ